MAAYVSHVHEIPKYPPVSGPRRQCDDGRRCGGLDCWRRSGGRAAGVGGRHAALRNGCAAAGTHTGKCWVGGCLLFVTVKETYRIYQVQYIRQVCLDESANRNVCLQSADYRLCCWDHQDLLIVRVGMFGIWLCTIFFGYVSI